MSINTAYMNFIREFGSLHPDYELHQLVQEGTLAWKSLSAVERLVFSSKDNVRKLNAEGVTHVIASRHPVNKKSAKRIQKPCKPATLKVKQARGGRIRKAVKKSKPAASKVRQGYGTNFKLVPVKSFILTCHSVSMQPKSGPARRLRRSK